MSLTDHIMPMAEFVASFRRTHSRGPLGPPSVRRAKRQWARMVSLRIMEASGHLWTLPRGAVFAAVDRYLSREALRGRRDLSVEEALERTGMTPRYRYQMRHPRRTAQEHFAALAALVREIADDHHRRFYAESLPTQTLGTDLRPAA